MKLFVVSQKVLSFMGASPPETPTRDSVPGPRWGLRSQTPAASPHRNPGSTTVVDITNDSYSPTLRAKQGCKKSWLFFSKKIRFFKFKSVFLFTSERSYFLWF